MPLYKLHDFDPSYRDTFGGDDIKGLDVYTDTNNEKVGSVHDVLVDDEGRFRYLIVDTGFWVFGKKVLLPVGQSMIDYNQGRVFARFSKEQVQDLPEFSDNLKVDYDYEERVRGVSAAPMSGSTMDASAPVEASGLMNQAPVDPMAASAMSATAYDRNTYNYDRDASLYNLNDRDHQSLRLYEERLIANKTRQKTGTVTIGKHVETDTARVAVPLEKERVVIERTAVTGAARTVTPGDVDFHEGEVARVEVYEETPDIRKEAFVREEVKVKKVTEQETVNAEDVIRRQELDVDTEGNPVISNNVPANRQTTKSDR